MKMTRTKQTILLALMTAFMLPAWAEDMPDEQKAYYEDRQRGYWFYEPVPVPVEEPEPPPLQPVAITAQPAVMKETPPKELAPRQMLRKIGEGWEDSLAVVIMNPTEENIKKYMEYTARVTAMVRFATKEYKQAMWTNPEYDFKNYMATGNFRGAIVRGAEIDRDRDVRLEKISKTHGLLYFMRSDCPYCQRFEPTIKEFADEFKFKVIAISLDGKGSKTFPNPSTHIDLAYELGVQGTPTIFVVDLERNEPKLANFGMTDLTTLKDKVIFAVDGETSPNTVLAVTPTDGKPGGGSEAFKENPLFATDPTALLQMAGVLGYPLPGQQGGGAGQALGGMPGFAGMNGGGANRALPSAGGMALPAGLMGVSPSMGAATPFGAATPQGAPIGAVTQQPFTGSR